MILRESTVDPRVVGYFEAMDRFGSDVVDDVLWLVLLGVEEEVSGLVDTMFTFVS